MAYFNIQELGLPGGCWDALVRGCPPQSCPAGQFIYLQGTEAHHFYYLVQGEVKTFITSLEGDEKVLTLYRSGSLFGEASFFDRLPRMSSAMAITPCTIIPIDRALVTERIRSSPDLAVCLLQYLARTVRLLSTHVDDMAFLPADRRVAGYLLSLGRDEAGRLRCTHDEIAAMVGASRVTVSRVLSRFQARGWLKTGYGVLSLTCPQAMADWLAESGAAGGSGG